MRTNKLSQIDIDNIIKMYIINKLSTITIGENYNLGKKAINQLLRRNNIQLRTAAEGRYKGGRPVSGKKYREKEGYKESQKEYMKIYQPDYTIKNKEKIKENSRKYYYDNYERNRLVDKEYYQNNKEKIKVYREKYKLIRNEKHRERIKTDYLYKLKCNISTLIKMSFKSSRHIKNSKTNEILGCTIDEFKNYLESQFEPWMSWDNYGNPKDGIFEPNKTWDIDHIIPTSYAKTEDDIIKLNHYTNLKPLCTYYNRFIKSNKY